MTNIVENNLKKVTKEILTKESLNELKPNKIVSDSVIYSLNRQIINQLSEDVYYIYIYIYNNHSIDFDIEDFEKYINGDLINEVRSTFNYLPTYLKNKHNHLVDYLNEVFLNLDEIAEDLDLDNITHIKMGEGDSHNGGKTTLKIQCTSKVFFYKPRNSDVEYNLNNFINNIINEYGYEINNYETFSLCEEVKYISPAQEKDIKTFFINKGILSAVLYFLHSTDNHYENVILQNTNPYFIDLECFYAPINKKNELYLVSDFIGSLDSSIFRTGIFPIAISNSYMNISSLTGREDKVINPFYDYNSYEVKNNKFVSMNLNIYTSDQENLIKVDDKIIEPQYYIKELIHGFEYMTRKILNSKEKYIQLIQKVIGNADAKLRYVYRPTHVYERVLKLIREPFYMLKKDNAEEAISNIKKDNEPELIFSYEKEALLQGDIPIFYIRDRNLVLGNGKVIYNYFEDNLHNEIEKKINDFEESDLELELDNIKTSLILSDFNSERKTNYKPDETMLHSPLVKIKEIEEKIRDKNHLHVSFREEMACLSYVNGYLYETGGAILASAYCNKKITDTDSSFYDLIIKIKDNKLLHSEDINITDGLSSYLFITFSLYKLNNEPEYIEEIKRTINHIKEMDFKLLNIDYFSGLAGSLVVFNKIYDFIKTNHTEITFLQEDVFSIIDRIKDEILERDLNILGAGLAHGLSGVIFALNETQKNFPYMNLYSTIKKLIIKEDEQFRGKDNNYIDPRTGELAGYYLCYGLPGILQSRMRLSKEFKDDKMIKSSINRLINDLMSKENNQIENITLCHGLASVMDLFLDAYNFNYIDQPTLSKLSAVLKKQYLKVGITYCDNNINYGLGLSGFFYTLIRLENPGLPSIFLLDC